MISTDPGRLIHPLEWLAPDILLAAALQRPVGGHDGWLSLMIRDNADPVMPHALCNATLRQTAEGAYRALGIAGAHTALTPLVRALCVTTGAELERELRSGPPAGLLPPVPCQAARRDLEQAKDRNREVRLSVMAQLHSRRRLVGAAAVALTAINAMPPGALPALENCDGLLPCAVLPGWFELPPQRPPQRARKAREGAPV
jgi:hypothetical protein